MKTKEELNNFKEEIENINRKLKELTLEELKEVAGGRKKTGEEVISGGAELGTNNTFADYWDN